jgi:hypothetical protein
MGPPKRLTPQSIELLNLAKCCISNLRAPYEIYPTRHKF